MHSLRSNSTITHQVRMSYFELVQVGGALPVFVVADARHAGKSDGDAISGVHLGFGELGACDLPNRGLLQQTTHSSSSSSKTVTDKANTHTHNASPINASRVTRDSCGWRRRQRALLFEERRLCISLPTSISIPAKSKRVVSINCFPVSVCRVTLFSGNTPPSSAAGLSLPHHQMLLTRDFDLKYAETQMCDHLTSGLRMMKSG